MTQLQHGRETFAARKHGGWANTRQTRGGGQPFGQPALSGRPLSGSAPGQQDVPGITVEGYRAIPEPKGSRYD